MPVIVQFVYLAHFPQAERPRVHSVLQGHIRWVGIPRALPVLRIHTPWREPLTALLAQSVSLQMFKLLPAPIPSKVNLRCTITSPVLLVIIYWAVRVWHVLQDMPKVTTEAVRVIFAALTSLPLLVNSFAAAALKVRFPLWDPLLAHLAPCRAVGAIVSPVRLERFTLRVMVACLVPLVISLMASLMSTNVTGVPEVPIPLLAHRPAILAQMEHILSVAIRPILVIIVCLWQGQQKPLRGRATLLPWLAPHLIIMTT